MELEKGKVTMVIPLYNKVDAIRTTLSSVVTYHGNTPFECIIVDDNSTDGSSDIAKEFETKYPDLFTYVKIQHRGKYGPVNARNFGIRLCNSEYICFLDADDEVPEGHIDRSFEFMNKHKDFGCYGENRAFDRYEPEWTDIKNQYNPTDIHYFIHQLGTNAIHFCCFLYRTELVKDIPFRDCPSEDLVFLFTIMHRYKFYIDLTKFGMIYHPEHSDVGQRYNESYNLTTYDEAYYRWKQIIEDNPDFPYYIKEVNQGDYVQWYIDRIDK